MKGGELNLAQRPFVNTRPVKRLTIVLWIAAVALLAVDVLLYHSHFSGQGEKRRQQQELREAIDAERARVEALSEQLAGLDIRYQNEQSEFLNRVIGERSFSWSNLFDRLTELLPADVRLTSLTPRFGSERRRATSHRQANLDSNEVLLDIRGSAKSSEDLFSFIDRLFASPGFRDPDLSSEALQAEGELQFSLGVIYRPLRAEEAPPGPAAPEEGGTVEAVQEGETPAEPAEEA